MGKERKMVTQYDVAREAGVTRSMVSYVISGNTERSVAPQTRRRILEAIDRLGYHPNKAAQTLQQGTVAVASRRIGIIMRSADMFRRPYYTEIIEGIHAAAHEHKYQLHFIHFFEDFKDPVLFSELIHEEETGGLILICVNECLQTQEDIRLLERIRERIKLIVCIEWKQEGLSSVMFDRQGAAGSDVAYLFEHGYRDIAYIGEMDDRVTGVQKALAERGVEAENVIIERAYVMRDGYEAVRRLHQAGKLTRALVCGSDEVAIGVMCYLNEHHIAIPGEVAVISIDNIEASAYATPPLTTMNVQKTMLGAKAVELIVNGTARQGDEAVDVLLPTDIVRRSSC